VHLLSTWDEGIPDDIPHEHLYGITFNAVNMLAALQGIEGAASARTVATDGLTPGAAKLLPQAFPVAELVDGEPLLRRARRTKSPEEIASITTAVRVAERALGAAEAVLAPGITERSLTATFMEAMARAGVTTPSTQDVAWITSRQHPWRRAGRDVPVANGDLVAFDAGVVAGGYVGEFGWTHVVGGSTAATRPLIRRWQELYDRLLAACQVGEPCSDLLEAYHEARVPLPPMPVGRGLGLGFDVPLVTHALPQTAAEERFEDGMVLALTAFVWEEGVGAVYGQEPVVVRLAGPQLLSAQSIDAYGA
jgi:Xaa-Pro aminopeptidase